MSVFDNRIARRSFMQLLAANSALLAASRTKASNPNYIVGVGYNSDAYTAASRAIAASGQFATNLAGQTVVIKPNLTAPKLASTGITTDPQVVRAIVDQAIAVGATDIRIIEASPLGKPAFFDDCGYTAVFQSYPQVQLVDVRQDPYSLTPVPGGGYAHEAIWIPSVVVQPNTYFISAAKLKTHTNAVVTLSMKCLVGLGSLQAYAKSAGTTLRLDFHYRGIDLAIMDLNLARPIDFAVIDGVWGMEGQGPAHGTRVATDVVLAGLNAVAVDRVGLDVMELPQNGVIYLTYATEAGLGPADTSNVTLMGDTYVPHPFTPALTPPLLWQPVANPNTISISAGQSTKIKYTMSSAGYTEADIIQDGDQNPGVTVVRKLHGLKKVTAAGETLVWDGKDQAGNAVAPGLYLAQVVVRTAQTPTKPVTYSTARITVTA